MFKLCDFSFKICANIHHAYTKFDIKLVRHIHNTFICNIKTIIKVNNYLLDRSIPASEILKNLTSDDAKTLEEIKDHHEFLLSKGNYVPRQLRDKDYLELLCLSRNQRTKFFKFLAKKEFSEENDAKRSSRNKEEKSNRQLEEFEHAKNQFYPKYVTKTIKDLETNLLCQALRLNNQEIVIDVSYEDDMYRKEVKYLASQINYCYSLNKQVAEPYQIVIANLQRNSITYADLVERFLPVDLTDCPYKKLEDFPIVISEKHYLDIFPDRRLIYLSPNSPNFFQPGEYDHDAVYIIGGIIDKSNNVPLSLPRARRERIEHRSFPLDRYVEWKSGKKSLTLDQAFKIMQIARDTNGDWASAITRSIPSRAMIDNSIIKFNRGFSRSRR